MMKNKEAEGKYMCSECDTLYDDLRLGCPYCEKPFDDFEKKIYPDTPEFNEIIKWLADELEKEESKK